MLTDDDRQMHWTPSSPNWRRRTRRRGHCARRSATWTSSTGYAPVVSFFNRNHRFEKKKERKRTRRRRTVRNDSYGRFFFVFLGKPTRVNWRPIFSLSLLFHSEPPLTVSVTLWPTEPTESRIGINVSGSAEFSDASFFLPSVVTHPTGLDSDSHQIEHGPSGVLQFDRQVSDDMENCVHHDVPLAPPSHRRLFHDNVDRVLAVLSLVVVVLLLLLVAVSDCWPA